MTRLFRLGQLLCIGLLMLSASCTVTRFARTQDVPGRGARSVEDVRIYVSGERPEQAYASIGVIEIHPGPFITLRGLYNQFRLKAAEAGADGVVQIRTTRRYYVDLDFESKRFGLRSYETYYGDAIIYEHAAKDCNVEAYGKAELHRCRK